MTSGKKWGDTQNDELVKLLLASRKHTAWLRWLGQLWVHHTALTDAGCPALCRLVSAAALGELHVSDTGITADGVLQIAEAARKAGYGRDGRIKLYINARHVPQAVVDDRLTQEQNQAVWVKGQRSNTAFSPAGRGRGSPSGRGRGGGRWQSGRDSPSAGRGSPMGRGSPVGRSGRGRGRGRGGGRGGSGCSPAPSPGGSGKKTPRPHKTPPHS